MADTIHCNYTGNMRVEMTKQGIKDTLHTAHDDAGEYVTPGDMLLSALGACTLTMMSVVAMKAKQNMDGTKIDVTGVFGPNAGGLEEVHLKVTFPDHVDAEMRKRYLAMVNICPVHKSLNPAIKFSVESN